MKREQATRRCGGGDGTASWFLSCAMWMLCGLLVLPASSAGAKDAAVAGGGEGLSGWWWWVRPVMGTEDSTLSVAAVDVSDGEAGLSADGTDAVPMRTLREVAGRVRPGAVAASADGRTLWAVFEGGAVAGWTVRDGGARGLGLSSQTGPALPDGGRVRGVAVIDGRPWVLWRAESGDAALKAVGAARRSASSSAGDVVRDLLLLKVPVDAERTEPADGDGGGDGRPGVDTGGDEAGAGSASEAAEKTEADAESAEPEPESVVVQDTEGVPDPETWTRGRDRGVVDVLWRLRGGRWEAVPLPSDWPDGDAVWVVAGGTGSAFPVLLAQRGDGARVWRVAAPVPRAAPEESQEPDQTEDDAESSEVAAEAADTPSIAGDGAAAKSTDNESLTPVWFAGSFALPDGEGGLRVVGVGGQVAVVRALGPDLKRGVWALRTKRTGGASDRDSQGEREAGALSAELLRIGVLSRPGDPGRTDLEESAVSLGQSLLLVALPKARDAAEAVDDPLATRGAWSAVDLNGRVLREGSAVELKGPRGNRAAPSQTVLMVVMMASTLVMLVFWRRDPAGQSYRLPEEAVLAALDRRALAGFIDLGVGLGAVWWWTGLTPGEVFERWPGRGYTLEWSAMVPAAWCIAVTIGHTLVSEALSGRSLGKALTGLRVVDQRGRLARGWRPAVRCLLKGLDLVAYLLLVLVVVSPLRQRLGDLVAGTVVVMRKPAGDDAGFEE